MRKHSASDKRAPRRSCSCVTFSDVGDMRGSAATAAAAGLPSPRAPGPNSAAAAATTPSTVGSAKQRAMPSSTAGE